MPCRPLATPCGTNNHANSSGLDEMALADRLAGVATAAIDVADDGLIEGGMRGWGAGSWLDPSAPVTAANSNGATGIAAPVTVWLPDATHQSRITCPIHPPRHLPDKSGFLFRFVSAPCDLQLYSTCPL